MPVASPGTSQPPALTARSLRRVAVLLAAVLALHLWLLGGLPHALHGPGDADTATAEAPLTLSTRLIAPPAPAPVVQQAVQPPAPRTDTPARAPVAMDLQKAIAPATQEPGPAAPPTSDAMPTGLDGATALSTTPAPAPANEPTATAPAAAVAPAPTERLPRFAFPPPVVLNYDVIGLTDGQKNVVSAAITWKHDGENYQASLQITKFLVSLRQWTSKGALTAGGLAPVRFGEKGFRRSEVASHFVRDEGRVIFSANSAPATLLPGAQDHLSVFMQLASLWAGEPNRLTGGDTLTFQSIGPKQAETWTFVVSPEEHITVPGGSMQAIKLTREATSDYSTKAEIWLAPQLAYLPAHIRLSEPNGNVLDMVWTDSQLP